jgi:hypothetical protein
MFGLRMTGAHAAVVFYSQIMLIRLERNAAGVGYTMTTLLSGRRTLIFFQLHNLHSMA